MFEGRSVQIRLPVSKPHWTMNVVLILLIVSTTSSIFTGCSKDRSIIPDDLNAINAPTIEAETGLSGVDADDLKTISGYSTSTEEITLQAGVLIIHGTSSGGLFSVNLVQDGANDLIFNETIRFSGSTAISIRDAAGVGSGSLQEGSAEVEIISSGDWSLSYTQEDIGATHESDFELSGYQDFVLPAVALDAGMYELTALNDVEFGHFSVEIIPRDGDGGLLVANTTSTEEETYEFEVNDPGSYLNAAGLYTFVITATGDWSISLN